MRIHNNLNWSILKALHDIYKKGNTSAKIQKNKYIQYLIQDAELLELKPGSKTVLVATEQFENFFIKAYLQRFIHYASFLQQSGLEFDARQNYNEEDIKTLMFIEHNKTEIKEKLTTQKNFSREFFKGKGSKYVENKKTLKRAICHILSIPDFPDQDKKDNNWRFVVDCKEPKAIVLCENLNFLKMPWVAESLKLKLWYVGGNNIKIIDQIDLKEFQYPFYYSCDWDHAGLHIYLRIKEKLSAEGKDISLLFPNNTVERLPTDSPHHYSKWNFAEHLSGLDETKFSSQAIQLIRELINKDEWIEEEYNDLSEMMIHNI